MNRKIRYTKAPKDIEENLARSVRVPDFLPPPEVLRRWPTKIRITIALDEKIINFFQREARKHNSKYQTMINDVLGLYADTYARTAKRKPVKSRKQNRY